MLPPWLADPGLLPLWRAVHSRLEQRGADWRGRTTITVSSEAERRALTALLGRTLRRGQVVVSGALLDELTATAGGLVAVVTEACGPVVDRRTLRAQQQADRERPVAAARQRLGDVAWADEWLAVVRRAAPTSREAVLAADLVQRLLAEHEAVARQDLAAGVCGDAHALDDGTALSTLVLRGLSVALGVPAPEHARARRELWEVAGVRLDSVSATALTLNLPGQEPDRPVHLTSRDVSLVRPADVVLICENPRVLEALADERSPLPVVCGGGNPNLVVLDVLSALRSDRARLLYHGDFDWPGLAIADRLITSHGVEPWQMQADDYLTAAASASLPLRGRPHEASWSPALTAAMHTRGVAVHEEALLPDLIEGLRGVWAARRAEGTHDRI